MKNNPAHDLAQLLVAAGFWYEQLAIAVSTPSTEDLARDIVAKTEMLKDYPHKTQY